MRVHFNDLPLPARERLHRIATSPGDPLLIAAGFGQVGRTIPWGIALVGVTAFAWLSREAAVAAYPWRELFAAAAVAGVVGFGFAAHLALGWFWPSSPFSTRDGMLIGIHAIRTFDGDLHVLSLTDASRVEVVKRRRFAVLRVECGAESIEVSLSDRRAADTARQRAMALVERYRHASTLEDEGGMASLDTLWEFSRGLRDDPSTVARGPRVVTRPVWTYFGAVLIALALSAAVLVPLWFDAVQRAAAARAREVR